MEDWTFVGKLKSGEKVYQGEDGSYAVEKYFENLVEPTWEEKEEIRSWQTVYRVNYLSGNE